MSTDGSTWVPTSLWALALGVLAWRARWGAKANRDIWLTRSGLDNAIYVWIYTE